MHNCSKYCVNKRGSGISVVREKGFATVVRKAVTKMKKNFQWNIDCVTYEKVSKNVSDAFAKVNTNREPK